MTDMDNETFISADSPGGAGEFAKNIAECDQKSIGELAFAPYNIFLQTLPKIKKALGTENVEIFFRGAGLPMSHNSKPHLMDTVVSVHNNEGLPIIVRRRLHDTSASHHVPSVEGFVIHSCRKDPNVIYASFCTKDRDESNWDCIVVPKGSVFRLVRLGRAARKEKDQQEPPVLDEAFRESILNHTIRVLDHKKEMKRHGVKINRGVILNGLPGNGKTMMCRYIRHLCNQKGIHYRTVSAQEILRAFSNDESLDELFSSGTIIFFDDIDIDFFNRSRDGKMACSILSAMDGMSTDAGHTIRIFTTNEDIADLDSAFTRPGRIDKSFKFPVPTRELRRELITTRWSKEVLEYLNEDSGLRRSGFITTHEIQSNLDMLLDDSDGYSFADLESIKTMMVTNKIVAGKGFDLCQALADIKLSKEDLTKSTSLGFGKQG